MQPGIFKVYFSTGTLNNRVYIDSTLEIATLSIFLTSFIKLLIYTVLMKKINKIKMSRKSSHHQQWILSVRMNVKNKRKSSFYIYTYILNFNLIQWPNELKLISLLTISSIPHYPTTLIRSRGAVEYNVFLTFIWRPYHTRAHRAVRIQSEYCNIFLMSIWHPQRSVDINYGMI